MSLADQFVALIHTEPVKDWPECAEALAKLITDLPERDLRFPLLACEAVGDDPEEALPVSLAWCALHLGVVLLDRVIDRDDLERFRSYEEIAALSSGPLFAAYHFLDQLEDAAALRRVARVLFQGFFACAQGQYLDLMGARKGMQPEAALKVYWRMTLLKSGSVYQAGLAAGAATGTEAPDLIEALGAYGRAFGVIKQLMDDCTDVLAPEGSLEWTLPILLYHTTKPSRRHIPTDRDALFKLLDSARIPETLAAVLNEWQRRALESLHPLPPSEAKQKLENDVTELVFPPAFFAPLGIH